MKFNSITGMDAIMIKPESLEEVGLMQWLAKRFQGQTVTLEFDTTLLANVPSYPMFWIKPHGVNKENKK